MKKTYFTVGPSQIFPTVPSHIKSAIAQDVLSMNHRGKEFKKMYESTILGLKRLLSIPDDYQVVFVSSALEAMERVSAGLAEKEAFHINTGFFGRNWQSIAKDLGKKTIEKIFFDWEKNEISEKSVENIKIPKTSELVCLTQNDTSVGFAIPMNEIYSLKKKYPNKLFALDVVSSAPYCDIEYKFLDAVFFSVQKGFGLPPGLCVLILSPKAIAKAQKLYKQKKVSIGSYHSLVKLVAGTENFQTTETPNILGIYLLDAILKDFQKIGIKTIRKQTDEKARMLYSFFSEPEYYTAFVSEERYRSITDPVINVYGKSEEIRKFAADFGLILGAGYKDFKNEHLRIANFPAQSIKDTEKLIKVLKKYRNLLK